MRAMVLGMLFVPPVIAASAWEAGWGRLGWYTLMSDQVEQPWLSGWRAAAWVHAMLGVPWVVLAVGPAFRGAAGYEQAASLEAPPFRVFFRVSLPYIFPFLAAAWVWVAAMTFAEMTVTDVYVVRTFAEELYLGYALGEEATLSWWQIALPSELTVLGLVLAAAWAGATATYEPELTPTWADGRPWRRLAWCALALLLTGLVCGAPLVNLVLKAGSELGADGAWSLSQLWETLRQTESRYREEFFWSLLVSAMSAVVTVVWTAPLAWLGRRTGWLSLTAPLMAALLLSLPAPWIGLGVGRVFQVGPLWWTQAYRYSILGPVVVQSLRAAPLVLLILWQGFRRLPAAPIEASLWDAPSNWSRWRWVVAPLAGPYLAAAGMAGMALSFGELAATVLVAPPGLRLFSTTLFGLIHFGVRHAEAGVCLLAMLLQFLLAALCGWFLRQAR